jgi:hypothetical protein
VREIKARSTWSVKGEDTESEYASIRSLKDKYWDQVAWQYLISLVLYCADESCAVDIVECARMGCNWGVGVPPHRLR